MSLIRLLSALALLAATTGRAANWNVSLATAQQQANASGRPIFINFTGSDWCPACIQLRTSILTSPEFEAFASQRLVLLEVDFPRTPIAALQLQANQQLARKYSVTAFPTLLVVDAEGNVAGQLSSAAPKDQFILALDYLARKATGSPGTPTAATSPSPLGNRTRLNLAPPRELPLFGGAATKPLPTYTNLIVKSISGSPSRRFALINSETMAAGDSSWFPLGTNRVQVQCVEVRPKSVLVRVHGEPSDRELMLSDIGH